MAMLDWNNYRRQCRRDRQALARHPKAEIAEALGTAISVNAGAALVYATRAHEAFKEA